MFTPEEKARIKHFLGYPDWVSLSQSIQLGYPAASQPAYLVDDAFRRLTLDGEAAVRRDLCECEAIEKQLSESRQRLKATEVAKVKMNMNEREDLRKEMVYWVSRLASDLGVVENPYSQFHHLGVLGGGRNARVEG